jgi:hypothetical protein
MAAGGHFDTRIDRLVRDPGIFGAVWNESPSGRHPKVPCFDFGLNRIEVSRNFCKDLREFRYLRSRRASVWRGPLITSSPRHLWLSTPTIADLL